ncbi:MAG: hypothetical protein CMJ83_16540 [Planctomycetes bacterium]|nr:hypothetical protein [Planctomycetota bacterium]
MRGFQGLAAALIAAAFCGCTEIDNPRTLAPGEPDVADTRSRELQRSQFDDIPTPPGFQYVTRGNRSFSFSRGGVRVGRFIYWGRMDVAEAAAFYRRNMGIRAYDWNLVSEDASVAQATFRYRKGQQDCTVTITRETEATYVRIDVNGPS